MISTCRFLNDAPFAYSITYDEGFIDVLANAWPIHKKYDIPGHLDVVAGQLGKRRDCFASSLNGLFHMGVEHLKFLIEEGWSVGNHTWSHLSYPRQPGLDIYKEVVYSKYYLEEKLETPITYFAVPGDNHNYLPSLPYIKQAGYLCCQMADGGVNYDDVDLLKTGNFMLASDKIVPRKGWPENLLTDNITLDCVKDGWLCETTHLVQPEPIQARKNVSCADLERRFEKILELGDGKAWIAVPEDIVDYILLRRSLDIKDKGDGRYELVISEFPLGTRKRAMSFKIEDKEQRINQIMVDGAVAMPVVPCAPYGSGRATRSAADGMSGEISFERRGYDIIFTLHDIRSGLVVTIGY